MKFRLRILKNEMFGLVFMVIVSLSGGGSVLENTVDQALKQIIEQIGYYNKNTLTFQRFFLSPNYVLAVGQYMDEIILVEALDEVE